MFKLRTPWVLSNDTKIVQILQNVSTYSRFFVLRFLGFLFSFWSLLKPPTTSPAENQYFLCIFPLNHHFLCIFRLNNHFSGFMIVFFAYFRFKKYFLCIFLLSFLVYTLFSLQFFWFNIYFLCIFG